MMGIESILQEITNEQSNKDQQLYLPFTIHQAEFRRNEIITQYNQIETKGYFLLEGILQCSIQKNGSERIIDFIFPNSFISAYNSFIHDIPSDMEITALTPCKVEYFLKAEVKKSFDHSLIAHKLGRYIKEKIITEKLRKEKELLTNSPEENYLELVTNRPEIIENIPVNKIAKYLGIHPESLSRIRSRIFS